MSLGHNRGGARAHAMMRGKGDVVSGWTLAKQRRQMAETKRA